jgi:hypothetical protein
MREELRKGLEERGLEKARLGIEERGTAITRILITFNGGVIYKNNPTHHARTVVLVEIKESKVYKYYKAILGNFRHWRSYLGTKRETKNYSNLWNFALSFCLRNNQKEA